MTSAKCYEALAMHLLYPAGRSIKQKEISYTIEAHCLTLTGLLKSEKTFFLIKG